jgi:hypothetical protein
MNIALFKILFAELLLAWAAVYVIDRVELQGCTTSDYPCWIWKGGGDGRYGHAYLLGERIKAHILSFLVFGGFLKRHHIVDHVCNRTNCVQPHHLNATSQSQNVASPPGAANPLS